jgi:hypothetical protein
MRPFLRGEKFGDAPALDYVDAFAGECLRLSTANPSIEGRLGRCLTASGLANLPGTYSSSSRS